jgi:septal ring factor EnvC (AmiA/AmiB activator)
MPLAVGALAQTPTSPEEAKKKLERQRRDLESVAKRAKTLEGDVSTLAAERERLNAKLVETAGLIKKSEGQLTSIE